MTHTTLHFRPGRTAAACQVCGADFSRHGPRDRWWLRNTWTDQRRDYHESGGCNPYDWLVPCGKLPADEVGEPPNVAGNRLARQGQSG